MRRCCVMLVVLLAGCDLPGKPHKVETSPNDFKTLYGKNCAGCHGADGKLGPAPPLNDPIFLAIASDEDLVKVIAAGRKGTEMPAFAKENGGTLSPEQVQALAVGVRKKWASANEDKRAWPAYRIPETKGDAKVGRDVFARACSMCHGDDGYLKPKAGVGPLNDPAFLGLASEQVLRRIIITGRSDLGMPNCAKHDGGALSADDVNDLVALLMSWKDAKK